jgi:hypothetical protein
MGTIKRVSNCRTVRRKFTRNLAELLQATLGVGSCGLCSQKLISTILPRRLPPLRSSRCSCPSKP